MKSLMEIEENLNDIAKLDEPIRTSELVLLMNYMEAHYRVFIINPTKEEMEKPEVKLYRRISDMRNI